jgi:hypothetical protein
MGAEELRSAVLRSAAAATPSDEETERARTASVTSTATRTATATATRPATATRTTTSTPAATVAPTPAAPTARTAVAVLAAPLTPLRPQGTPRAEAASPADAGGEGDPALESRIVGELRAALRGCSEAQLSSVLATPAADVGAALAVLAARGAAERRGTRWFTS